MAILATPHWVGRWTSNSDWPLCNRMAQHCWHSTASSYRSLASAEAAASPKPHQLPFVGDPTHRPQLQPLHVLLTVSAIPDKVAVASSGPMFSGGKDYDHIIICHKGQGDTCSL